MTDLFALAVGLSQTRATLRGLEAMEEPMRYVVREEFGGKEFGSGVAICETAHEVVTIVRHALEDQRCTRVSVEKEPDARP